MSGLNPAGLARRIVELQQSDGGILWVDDGIWDPWNHAEAAMGLMAAGHIAEARQAMAFLADAQRTDGAWEADMGCAAPMDADNRRLLAHKAPRIVDTNFCAYPAVAAWRLALTTAEERDLHASAAMIERALSFVTDLQRPDGAIPWRALEPGERPEDVEALLAGGLSILFSLRCATALFQALGRPADVFEDAARRLERALSQHPDAFADRSRYAMDWYYPVLTGFLPAEDGAERLMRRWRAFIEPRWGCRCVEDEPWATAAETAELALAADAIGAREHARALLHSLARHDDGYGALWMGRQFAEDRVWPDERPSWTAGAALMAWDAVEGQSRASALFRHALRRAPRFNDAPRETINQRA